MFDRKYPIQRQINLDKQYAYFKEIKICNHIKLNVSKILFLLS